jgi:hypothetical protein
MHPALRASWSSSSARTDPSDAGALMIALIAAAILSETRTDMTRCLGGCEGDDRGSNHQGTGLVFGCLLPSG